MQKTKKPSVTEQFKDVMSILAQMDYNPIQSLVRVAQNEELDWNVRIKAMTVVADKSVPSLKAIEMKNDDKQHAEMVGALKEIMEPLLEQHKKSY